jgi:hypothetical protein
LSRYTLTCRITGPGGFPHGAKHLERVEALIVENAVTHMKAWVI